MEKFLEHSTYIDWQHPAILNQAAQLADATTGPEDIAKKCFEFVRDGIRHSWDYRDDAHNPVTCKASDVLLQRTGYCYAKSHLLAALLRANGIPAGLCYQRLTITDQPPYCLHGLNAVHLPDHGWYRIDARGNKSNVDAQFCPPQERLAFANVASGEKYYEGIWSTPHAEVIRVLETYTTVEQVYQHVPDIGV